LAPTCCHGYTASAGSLRPLRGSTRVHTSFGSIPIDRCTSCQAIGDGVVFERQDRAGAQDAHTGLGNARHFREVLDHELKRAQEGRRPLALVLIDVDELSRLNHELGHLEGDAALQGLADCVRELTSSKQLAFRIGGDELAVVLPDSTLADGRRFRSRLSTQLRARPPTSSLRVSVTCGVVELERGEDPTSLLRRADRALHQGKQGPPAGPTGVREPRRPEPPGGTSSVRKHLEEDG
jgi:diguanylate cyclase (GGDEF)-like protein